jgi:DNA-binding MarR family transcriptional regulator
MRESRSELQRQIFEDMNAAKRLMQPYFGHILENFKLSYGKAHVLATVAESQPISLKTLADKVYMTPGGITQLIDNLEGLGYVARKRDSKDRRITYIYITEAGANIVATINKQRDKLMTIVLDTLTDTEIEHMAAIQRKTTIQLEEYVKEYATRKENA